MKHVRLADIPWDEWTSPSGLFRGAGKQVSVALGAVTNAHLAAGGHPFDLEFGRLPPGKSGCPFHSHSAQWELFVIASGAGAVRHGEHTTTVRAGDAVMHPPGEAHQLTNTGDTELTYWLIADNPLTEVWHYPDSNKIGYRPAGGVFRRQDVAYWDDQPDSAVEPRPAPPATPPATFVTLAELPWEEQRSPTGKYHSFSQNISLALGGIRDVGTWGGGHPFDLQRRRIPVGASICPLHRHTAQWELFIIQAGTATIRSGDGQRLVVTPGDIVLQPPGTAHQFTNTGSTDAIVDIIADHHRADSTYYPESDKWQIKPQRKLFRMVETDYFDGEE